MTVVPAQKVKSELEPPTPFNSILIKLKKNVTSRRQPPTDPTLYKVLSHNGKIVISDFGARGTITSNLSGRAGVQALLPDLRVTPPTPADSH